MSSNTNCLAISYCFWLNVFSCSTAFLIVSRSVPASRFDFGSKLLLNSSWLISVAFFISSGLRPSPSPFIANAVLGTPSKANLFNWSLDPVFSLDFIASNAAGAFLTLNKPPTVPPNIAPPSTSASSPLPRLYPVSSIAPVTEPWSTPFPNLPACVMCDNPTVI